MKKRFCTPNAIGLLIIREYNNKTEILLQKRNDCWDLAVGGHVEANESLTDAAIREAKEEIGIDIPYKSLNFVTCSYTKFKETPYNFFYFSIKEFYGKPEIKEPDRCQELKWFDIHNLPESIINDVKLTINNYLNGINFVELGW